MRVIPSTMQNVTAFSAVLQAAQTASVSNKDLATSALPLVMSLDDFAGRVSVLDILLPEARSLTEQGLRTSIKFKNSEIAQRIEYTFSFLRDLEAALTEDAELVASTIQRIAVPTVDQFDRDNPQYKPFFERVPGIRNNNLIFLYKGVRSKALVHVWKESISQLRERFNPNDGVEQNIYTLVNEIIPPIGKPQFTSRTDTHDRLHHDEVPLNINGVDTFLEDRRSFVEFILRVVGIE